MAIKKCLVLILTGFLCIINVEITFGNGRTTPQLRNAVIIKAVITLNEGREIEILRVRVFNGDVADGAFTVSRGGIDEEIPLNEIKQVVFNSTETDSKGFLKANIYLKDGSEDPFAMVRVLSENNNIILKGFKHNGTPISIDLLKCQSIEFYPINHTPRSVPDSVPAVPESDLPPPDSVPEPPLMPPTIPIS